MLSVLVSILDVASSKISTGCKIGNFQTESNVIMLHKHSNKSKLYKKRSIKYS
jgi:hypothetical protein